MAPAIPRGAPTRTHRCCKPLQDAARYLCANSSWTASLVEGESPRLLVLHVATAHALSYAATAAAVNAAWAERFGHVGVLAMDSNEPREEVWRWGKVKALADVFARYKGQHADYYLYMDVDAVLADFSMDTFRPLLRKHEEADLLVSREPAVKASKAASNGANDWSGGRQDFNNGVLLVRNSAWSRRFVAEWSRRLALDPAANDQEILQVLYDGNVMGAARKVAVLPPGAVNSEMSSPVGTPGQRVVHLGGLPDAVRSEVFGIIHAAVCSGRFEAFGGGSLQEAFLASMAREADAPRPRGKGKAKVNAWLQVRQRLALALQTLGRKAEALEHMQRVWQGRRKLFGEDSHDALAALLHYAHAAEDDTRLLEAWHGFQRLHGPQHQDTRAAASLAAGALLAAGRHAEALAAAEAGSAAKGAENSAAEGTSVRTVALNNLGMQHLALGRRAEGEAMLRQSAKSLGDPTAAARAEHSARQILQNLALALEDLGGPARKAEAQGLRHVLASSAGIDAASTGAAASAEAMAASAAIPQESTTTTTLPQGAKLPDSHRSPQQASTADAPAPLRPHSSSGGDLPSPARKHAGPPATATLVANRGSSDAAAQLHLAGALGEGQDGHAADLEAAERLYRQAIKGGELKAHNALGMLLLRSAGRAAEAAHHFRISAGAGDVAAQLNLASLLTEGRNGDVSPDEVKATYWFRRAAESGQPVAQYNLFVSLFSGRGTQQNIAEAMRWLHTAAAGGLARAQAELGAIYEEGTGGMQSHAEAAKWYSKAAEQGDADAQVKLAMLHISGRGVLQDQAEANRLFREAAARGHITAQVNLALVYRHGYGVPRDGSAAERWLRRAAEGGAAQAQFGLAEMLDSRQPPETGGPVKDDAGAAAWYQRAAAQNHYEAQYRLGKMLMEGRGVMHDPQEAGRWLALAAESGHAVASAFLSAREAPPESGRPSGRSARGGRKTPSARSAPRPLPESSSATGRPESLRWEGGVAPRRHGPPSVPSVYGPPPRCPFKDLDLVLYTGLRDAAILPYLLQSVQLFMPCYGLFRAIVPALELPVVQPQLMAAAGSRLRVYPEQQPPWLARVPWVWRIAYTALYLDVLAADDVGRPPPKFFAFLDSDVVLAYPVTCQDLFEASTGRPWAYYWPHIVHGNLANTERLFNSSSGAYRLGSFMSYFPQVYPASALRVTRQRLRAAYGGVTFEEAFRRHAEVGNMDFYSLIAHAAYFDETNSTPMAFVSCPPAIEAAAALSAQKPPKGSLHLRSLNIEQCAQSAHVGVHVPYDWQRCVDHRGPGCSDAFQKFDPQPMEGEVGRPSEQFLLTAAEIMHRGACFAHRHYGEGTRARLLGCAEPLLRGRGASSVDDVHWRVWAYGDEQGGLPPRVASEVVRHLVDSGRTRETCGPQGG